MRLAGLKNKLVVLTAAILAAAASAAAIAVYPGSIPAFLVFDASYLALVLLLFPKPRLYSYTFFAIMLFLGFWLKTMMHLIFGQDFLEPVGAFDGRGESWDRALAAATCGALGAIAARVVHLVVGRMNPNNHDRAENLRPAPSWYRLLRKPVWILSVVLMLGLNLVNYQLAFYQVGVHPKLILPMHLNVFPAWLINVGFSLWFATLIFWEFRLHPQSLRWLLFIPIAESLASSLSVLSRSFFLFHTAPYVLALVERWKLMGRFLTGNWTRVLAPLWIACFVVSIAAVSLLRVQIYQPETGSAAATAATTPTSHGRLKSIFLQRWIGLEGVLAISSYPGVGFGLLREAIGEDPKKGTDTLYQHISNSQYIGYQAFQGFTFLNPAGVIAILFFSGSLLAVAAGMAMITSLLIGTELISGFITGNDFLRSVIGLSTANVICQLNFPYLGAIFFAQLWVALAFIWSLQILPLHRVLGSVTPKA